MCTYYYYLHPVCNILGCSLYTCVWHLITAADVYVIRYSLLHSVTMLPLVILISQPFLVPAKKFWNHSLSRNCFIVVFHSNSWIQSFQHDITGRVLLRINENILLRLGIENEEHRMDIWREIMKLHLKTDILEIRDIERRNNMNYDWTHVQRIKTIIPSEFVPRTRTS